MLALSTPTLEPLTALVDRIKEAWRSGGLPDAASVLRTHPELMQYRSLVVDLVYEEYCLCEETGKVLKSEEFCRRFPIYQSHIRDVIRGHRLLANHPELVQPTIAWPRPGDLVDQLTILRELGRGAFARVYLAREAETGDRPVVVKLSVTRSIEARTLGGISHNHIVSILWARQVGGLFAVCMPFVGSLTLRDGIESWFQLPARERSGRTVLNALATPESPQLATSTPTVLTGRESHSDALAAIASRLADAVGYLHRQGISHGDLKPSNILLGSGAFPYLIDFNLSVGHADALLRRGGTLPYMPPEQLRLLLGGPDEGTAMAGDVYSFGVVLFEAMTGRVPFEPGEGSEPPLMAADMLRRQASCGSRPTHLCGIPKSLARLIDSCLDPNPSARPSIDQVKEAIDLYRNRRRRRWWSAGIGSIASCLACSLAMQNAKPLAMQPSPIPSSLEAKPQNADEHIARGLRYLKADDFPPAMSEFGAAYRLSPDGRICAYFAYSLQDQPAAQEFYQKAKAAGFSPAWVHNNLARALNLSGLPEQLQEAVIEANAALALDPGLKAARLNRADARYKLSLRHMEASPVSPESIADIEEVMRAPQETVLLYHKAATITVKFGGDREDCRARAVMYLKEAIRLGRKPEDLASDPVFRPLVAYGDFNQLLGLTPGTPAKKPLNPYLTIPPLE